MLGFWEVFPSKGGVPTSGGLGQFFTFQHGADIRDEA
jgi:hypothetical protein